MGPFSDMTVIFDLDGTLVDSAPDLAAAMNHVLQGLGRDALPLEKVRHLVGQGAAVLLAHGLKETGGHDFSDARMEGLRSEFLDHYQAHIADHSTVFAGVGSCLDRLQMAGVPLAVCTNKTEKLALSLLQEVGLIDRFTAVIGRDTLPTCKPHPAPLLECLKRCQTRRGVMIGDTMTDYAAARGASMEVYLFSGGYWKQGDRYPEDAGTFHSFNDLFDLIAGEVGSL